MGEVRRYVPIGEMERDDENGDWVKLGSLEAVEAAVKVLRDEKARLRAEYVKLFRLAEPIAKMLTELTILPIGCSREQELAWKMAVKNFRHYQRDYAADVLLQAALTPQGGKGGGG